MRFWTVLKAGLVTAGVLWAGAALAVPLQPGSVLSFTSGAVSVQVTVNSCTLGASNCDGADQIVQDDSYLGVRVQSSLYPSSSGDILEGTGLDMTLSLDIRETNIIATTPLLTAATLSIFAQPADGTPSAGWTFISPAANTPTATPGSPQTALFNPVTNIQETLDLQPDAFGSPSAITSVTQDFLAPEPAGTSLLALGLVGIAWFRRRRIWRASRRCFGG